MREIKFRAWDREYKCWDDWLWLRLDGILYEPPNNTYDTPNQEIVSIDKDRYELVQFTGLHDKNGKEIWEGDVVQWQGYEVQTGRQIRPIRKFSITWDYYELSKVMNIISGNQTLEVIGNIYENPEWRNG